MPLRQKVLVSWSSGKDSAYTLHTLQQSTDYQIAGLLTTVTQDFNRVAMHSTRVELLKKQAKNLNLPLHIIHIPKECSNDIYEQRMLEFILRAAKKGITHIAFGDLFLEDIRQYREKQMSQTQLKPIFPIFGRDTKSLAHEMIDIGIKAVITCIDSNKLDHTFVGRTFDREFLLDLPEDVDPCGENGEFHTFVYDAPMFNQAIPIEIGKTAIRDRFVFKDIIIHELMDNT